MPFANHHSCRLAEPDNFSEFRTIARGKTNVIVGKNKSTGKWEAQSIRYPTGNFTADAAAKSCATHGGKFEAAATAREASPDEYATIHGDIWGAQGEALMVAEDLLQLDIAGLQHLAAALNATPTLQDWEYLRHHKPTTHYSRLYTFLFLEAHTDHGRFVAGEPVGFDALKFWQESIEQDPLTAVKLGR